MYYVCVPLGNTRTLYANIFYFAFFLTLEKETLVVCIIYNTTTLVASTTLEYILLLIILYYYAYYGYESSTMHRVCIIQRE